jgi:CHAT domain-containing protein
MLRRRTIAVTTLTLLLTTGGAARKSSHAQEWSELAALRFAQGIRSDDAGLIFEALGAADHALRIDPRCSEAIVSRKAALEALHLSHLRVVYRSTRRAVGNSLREAVHRGAYSEVVRLVRAFPQEARTWAERESFAEWAYGMGTGRREYASRELDVTRAIGGALRATSGDAFVAEAVRAIDNAVADHDQGRIDALVRAHVQYADGMTRAQWPSPKTSFIFERATINFVRGQSPMAFAARVAAGNVELQSSFTIHVFFRGWTNAAPAIPPEFISIRARDDWQQSLRWAKQGEFAKSSSARLRAIKAFDSLGEHENAAILRNLEADILSLTGDRAESWRMRRAAFRSAEVVKDEPISEQILTNATRDAVATQKWDVARSLASLVVDGRAPFSFPASPLRSEALLMRSIAEWNGRDLIVASQDLQRARMSIAAADHRMDFILGWLEAVNDSMTAGKSPPQWDEAIALQSAREAAKRSDIDLALTIYDLTELGDFGYVREGLSDRAYADLLDFVDTHGRATVAFRLNESRQAHILLARMGYGDATFFGVDEIRERLPQDTAIISFVSLENRLLIFTIDRGGFRVSRRAIRHDALVRRLSVFTSSAREGSDERAVAMDLYQLLIGAHPDAGTLVMVPDPTLAHVPFAALMNPVTGKHLAEEAAIVIDPSAGLFVKLTAIAQRTPETALIVGDPEFDPVAHQGLSRLPDAGDEARTIGRMYRSTVLTGDEATAVAFLSRISKPDVTHVAAHVLINPRDVMQSGIVMADGNVSIRDVMAQHVKRGSLVVLVGCRSAERNGESDVGSLALAFLAAGSRSSVGALWDIDDAASRRFAIGLHTLLRAGVRVSEAVRLTQVQMLRSKKAEERNTRAWAGFQVYGGS